MKQNGVKFIEKMGQMYICIPKTFTAENVHDFSRRFDDALKIMPSLSKYPVACNWELGAKVKSFMVEEMDFKQEKTVPLIGFFWAPVMDDPLPGYYTLSCSYNTSKVPEEKKEKVKDIIICLRNYVEYCTV